MKRFVLIGLLCLAGGSAFALEITAGAVASGLTAWGGEAVVLGPREWLGDSLGPDLGIEAGMRNSQARVLVPVGLLWETYLEEGWSWGLAAHGLVGTSIPRKAAWLWGAEGQVRTEFAWVPGFAVGLAGGARYLVSGWEFPVHLFFEIPLGPEDPLEPYEEAHDGRK